MKKDSLSSNSYITNTLSIIYCITYMFLLSCNIFFKETNFEINALFGLSLIYIILPKYKLTHKKTYLFLIFIGILLSVVGLLGYVYKMFII